MTVETSDCQMPFKKTPANAKYFDILGVHLVYLLQKQLGFEIGCFRKPWAVNTPQDINVKKRKFKLAIQITRECSPFRR